jgi:aerobic-type carbon monoxide dehydrogenase small subunit (CoxS/CutS family)
MLAAHVRALRIAGGGCAVLARLGATRMPREIELHINGRRRIVVVEPDTPLLHVLRNDLGLTAAKHGCGLEQCHACAVLVDGRATTTCATAVEAFVGRAIVTLEGLCPDGELHPVARAFVAEEAAQCGYCIPGMVIGAVALLEGNPHPSDSDIRAALDAHLCRCGSHWRIIKAVHRAAAERSR